MSASENNLERQKKRHIGPLVGMAVVVLFALGIFFFWMTEEAERAPGPQGQQETPAATQTQEVAPTAPGTSGTTGTPTAPGPTPEPAIPAAPITPPTPAPAD